MKRPLARRLREIEANQVDWRRELSVYASVINTLHERVRILTKRLNQTDDDMRSQDVRTDITYLVGSVRRAADRLKALERKPTKKARKPAKKKERKR